MKLSELIKEAQDLLFKHGDLEVNILYDVFYDLELIHRKANWCESEIIEAKSTSTKQK